MDESTRRFLEEMNRRNAAIAARDAERARIVEPDKVRLQREAKRREKYGQLRAREKPSKRPHRARHLFGSGFFMNNDSQS